MLELIFASIFHVRKFCIFFYLLLLSLLLLFLILQEVFHNNISLLQISCQQQKYSCNSLKTKTLRRRNTMTNMVSVNVIITAGALNTHHVCSHMTNSSTDFGEMDDAVCCREFHCNFQDSTNISTCYRPTKTEQDLLCRSMCASSQ